MSWTLTLPCVLPKNLCSKKSVWSVPVASVPGCKFYAQQGNTVDTTVLRMLGAHLGRCCGLPPQARAAWAADPVTMFFAFCMV